MAPDECTAEERAGHARDIEHRTELGKTQRAILVCVLVRHDAEADIQRRAEPAAHPGHPPEWN